MMKQNKGFTLIELMIVVAIIGVLSAIAYPSYNAYMQKSKRSDAKIGLMKLADKQERFYLQNDTYTTDITGATGLNTSATSDEGYYTFAVTAGANGIVSGFVLTATVAAGQVNDTTCKTLSLSSTGAKTAADSGGGDTSDVCW